MHWATGYQLITLKFSKLGLTTMDLKLASSYCLAEHWVAFWAELYPIGQLRMLIFDILFFAVKVVKA